MLWVEIERLGAKKTKVETTAAARGNAGDGRLRPAGNTVSLRSSQGPFYFLGHLLPNQSARYTAAGAGAGASGSLSRPR